MGPRRLFDWLFSPGKRLSTRTLQSGVWSMGMNVSNRVLQLGSTIILANLLNPYAFGVVGIGLLLVVGVGKFTNPQFRTALVQHEAASMGSYIDTTWILNLVRGVVLYGLLFVGAPLPALVFNDPTLVPVVRAVGLIIPLKTAVNPSVMYFQRDLKFQYEFAYQISGTFTNVAVSIGIALTFGTYRALVAGILAGWVVQVLVSFLIPEYRPSLGFDLEKARELFSFSRWIYGTVVVSYLTQSGDDAFVGWFFGSASVGLYRLAYRFGNTAATELANVVLSVMFPAFAKIRDDISKTRSVFCIVYELLLLLAIPIGVGILLIAREFTVVFLGPEWTPMVPAMQVLAIGSIVRALQETGFVLFRGTERPGWEFQLNALRLGILVLSIWPLSATFGLQGTAASFVLGLFLTLPVWGYRVMSVLELRVASLVRPLVVPLLASSGMALVVVVIRDQTVLRVVAAIISGMIVYPLLLALGLKLTGRNIISDLREITDIR